MLEPGQEGEGAITERTSTEEVDTLQKYCYVPEVDGYSAFLAYADIPPMGVTPLEIPEYELGLLGMEGANPFSLAGMAVDADLQHTVVTDAVYDVIDEGELKHSDPLVKDSSAPDGVERRGHYRYSQDSTPMAEARILDSAIDLLAQGEDNDAGTPLATACIASNSGSSSVQALVPALANEAQSRVDSTAATAATTASIPAFPVAQAPLSVPPPVPAIQMELVPAFNFSAYPFTSAADGPPSLGMSACNLLTPGSVGRTPTDAMHGQEAFPFTDDVAPTSSIAPSSMSNAWAALYNMTRRDLRQESLLFSGLSPIGLSPRLRRLTGKNLAREPSHRPPRYIARGRYRCAHCGQPKLGHECQAMLQVSGEGTQTDLHITAPHRVVTTDRAADANTEEATGRTYSKYTYISVSVAAGTKSHGAMSSQRQKHGAATSEAARSDEKGAGVSKHPMARRSTTKRRVKTLTAATNEPAKRLRRGNKSRVIKGSSASIGKRDAPAAAEIKT